MENSKGFLENVTEHLWSCDGIESISAEELRIRIYTGNPSFIALMSVPLLILGLMVVLFIDESLFLIRNSTKWKQTATTLWVVSIYPVLGSLSIIGIFMPRTVPVISFMINFYFSLILKKFFDLVLLYYGGKRKMVEALGEDVVPTNPFPCCFVCCYRNRPMTRARIKRLKMTVYQVIFLYPIAYFIQTLMASEGLLRTRREAQIVLLIVEIVVLISGFVCLYGFSVIGKSSIETLGKFRIKGKFYSVSLVVPCSNLQVLIFQLLDRFQALPCGFPYPSSEQAFLFHSYIFVYELFLISILAWISYRRLEPIEDNVSSNVLDIDIIRFQQTDEKRKSCDPRQITMTTLQKDFVV